MFRLQNTVGVAPRLTGLAVLLSLSGVMMATAALAQKPEVRIERAAERAEWEISFPDEISLEEYARQLDFFKIEIAAVSSDGRVEYISHVSELKPEKHVGQEADDPRLYIGWKSGTLHAVDRRLLLRAGINSNRKEIRHYFPEETQRVMKQIERAYASRDPREIVRTQFEIRPLESGEGYEFVVAEQDPPRESASKAASSSRNQPIDSRRKN